METAKPDSNKKKVWIAIVIMALVTAGVSYWVIRHNDSWVTKSTIQRKALPADQCKKTGTWYEDEKGKLITSSDEEDIFNGMEYFYQKTGVQPYLWVSSFYDQVIEIGYYRDREKAVDQILSDKYDELFGTDEGHVLIAVSYIFRSPNFYYWMCYPGDSAKLQVMDDEAMQILIDCLSYMLERDYEHVGRSIGKAFIKAADIMMTDQTYQSYAVAIVIAVAFIFIMVICIVSIRKSGKENVAYSKTLKAREEARKEEAIADQKQTEFDRKKYEDELETQYMAIPCPNCGGSGNKIRKGTVGICKYCGTAIKVGRDGKIEFLSNDD